MITAVPLYAAARFFPDYHFEAVNDLEYSTIVNIHVCLKKQIAEKMLRINRLLRFNGYFNHGTHLTLVISDANYLTETAKEEIINIPVRSSCRFTGIEKN